MLTASAREIARFLSESFLIAIMLGIARNAMIPMMLTAARTSTMEKALRRGFDFVVISETVGGRKLLEFYFGVGIGVPRIEEEILARFGECGAFHLVVIGGVGEEMGDRRIIEIGLDQLEAAFAGCGQIVECLCFGEPLRLRNAVHPGVHRILNGSLLLAGYHTAGILRRIGKG